MGKYIELNNDNFKETVSNGVSLVDFWAPWCGPCKMLSPVIDQLAEDFEGKANICKVNTDEQSDLATEFAIRSIPTLFVVKNGEVVDTVIGAKSKEDLTNLINHHLEN